MNAFLFSQSFYRLGLFFCLLLTHCTSPEQPEQNIQRSFYYWKSVFQLSAKEDQIIDDLSIRKLYVKLFDVQWDDLLQKPRPAATIRFRQQPLQNLSIIPVVFITNEAVQKATAAQIDLLAQNITQLLSGLVTTNKLSPTDEVQIDCDWTAGTKEKYFQLLQKLKLESLLEKKILSVTIRLHQLKFISEAGVPPADKGLLMCYNMGNLRHPSTKNSIIDTKELTKYISTSRSYPLPLDVALPLFQWYVWFHQNQYKGLIHNYLLEGIGKNKEKIIFNEDTVIDGFHFKKGDWLRYETSDLEVVKKAAQQLKNKLSYDGQTIILYHLDEKNLKKYTRHELEDIYNSFH